MKSIHTQGQIGYQVHYYLLDPYRSGKVRINRNVPSAFKMGDGSWRVLFTLGKL